MKKTDFKSGFPGRLQTISFVEDRGEARAIVCEAFVPDALPPKIDRDQVVASAFNQIERATRSLTRLESAVGALPSQSLLLSAMRMREAQASSKIENTFASLQEMALAGASQPGATHDALEVIRNRMAIEAGLRSELPICRRLICEMHAVLITDRKNRPGELRDVPVCIGDEKRPVHEARFVPPPPSELEACFRSWEEFVNRKEQQQGADWPYLVRLAMNHYQFETIHPFSDGNGRLGRAIVNLAPVKDGFLKQPVCNLSEWVQTHRSEYYDCLLHVSTRGACDLPPKS